MDRIDRVNSLIKDTVAFILTRRMKDPRLGLITIHDVVVSRDLQNAKIYFGVTNLSEKDETEVLLNAASSFIRKELGKEITLRHIPKLQFIYDNSYEKGDRIFRLLRKIKKDETE
ncbi:MAG: 30S ribosome-binding factor RbfA [Candidatus Wallbacteria bacterium]|nr:30S ribosome-binding factor RbfA [Candidatus Wallbacteria bacterium]